MSEVPQDILNDFLEQPKATTIRKRIVASILDGLILMVVFIIMGNLFGERYEETTTKTTTIASPAGQVDRNTTTEVTTSSGFHLEGWPALAFMACWFFLMPFREGTSGQTIGKRVLGIKVVRSNGDPVNVGISFIRHLFDIVDCFLLIGLIIASLNPQCKRIGDLIAGTYVAERR